MLCLFCGYWLALLAFWAKRADSLLALQDALIFLLAGQAAPVGLLPEGIKRLAQILPFRYMVGFPVEILTGQLSGAEIRSGLVLQTGWLIVAVALYRVMWVTGVRRYAAVGG